MSIVKVTRSVTRLDTLSSKDICGKANVVDSQKGDCNGSSSWSKQEDQQLLAARERFSETDNCMACITHCRREKSEANDSPPPYWVSLLDEGYSVQDVGDNVKEEQTKV